MADALNEVANFHTKLVKTLRCNKTSVWGIIISIYVNLLHLYQIGKKKKFAFMSDNNHLHCYTFLVRFYLYL